MKKILMILGVALTVPALATEEVQDVTEEVQAVVEEAPVVAERVSCADMNTKIAELSAIEAPDETTIQELTELKAEYRRACAKFASGRRTSGRSGAVVAPVVASEEETTTTETVAETVVEEVAEPVILSDEQKQANLDAGLCADGTSPNRFGCCTGEKFTDLGNLNFACCPDDGVSDCFPPIK